MEKTSLMITYNFEKEIDLTKLSQRLKDEECKNNIQNYDVTEIKFNEDLIILNITEKEKDKVSRFGITQNRIDILTYKTKQKIQKEYSKLVEIINAREKIIPDYETELEKIECTVKDKDLKKELIENNFLKNFDKKNRKIDIVNIGIRIKDINQKEKIVNMGYENEESLNKRELDIEYPKELEKELEKSLK